MEKANRFKTTVVRREHFNAAHRLHNENWNAFKNNAVFGKCNNPNGHGHNYELEVKVTGNINPETGFVMDTKLLSDLIREEVIERLDHKNLNLDVAEFKNLNPTAENIAFVIYELLRPCIPAIYKLHLKLYETSRNYVEYPAE